jgi:hypothetical protein
MQSFHPAGFPLIPQNLGMRSGARANDYWILFWDIETSIQVIVDFPLFISTNGILYNESPYDPCDVDEERFLSNVNS